MKFSTADLCDQFASVCHLQIAEPIFKVFGGQKSFAGQITTLKTFEDEALLASVLREGGRNRVLVVDGGASHRCALLDKRLAQVACDNGWEGLVIYGCIRQSIELATMSLGILALHAHPSRSHQRGGGDRDQMITFAGINFRRDNFIYVDEDGVLVADHELL
jgi:regulator of ribonuclease activity A